MRKAQRCLFGRPTEEDRELEREKLQVRLDDLLLLKSREYGFDFSSGVPLSEGNYEWQMLTFPVAERGDFEALPPSGTDTNTTNSINSTNNTNNNNNNKGSSDNNTTTTITSNSANSSDNNSNNNNDDDDDDTPIFQFHHVRIPTTDQPPSLSLPTTASATAAPISAAGVKSEADRHNDLTSRRVMTLRRHVTLTHPPTHPPPPPPHPASASLEEIKASGRLIRRSSLRDYYPVKRQRSA